MQNTEEQSKHWTITIVLMLSMNHQLSHVSHTYHAKSFTCSETHT